jgi:UPF0271 protein
MDINSDVGELQSMLEDGTQEALMPFLTSVNIACGGHAGDEQTMRTTVEQARRHGLAIGAHPGYPDRENFGRLELDMPLEAVEQTVYDQICTLADFAPEIKHVKPHGALYNQAVKNTLLAAAIARGVARYSREVTLVGLAGSAMLYVFREEGFKVFAEAFADRRYEADGTLRSRKHADALIGDPAVAAVQAVRIAREGKAQTICIHSDTPGSVAIARAVSEALRAWA